MEGVRVAEGVGWVLEKEEGAPGMCVGLRIAEGLRSSSQAH